MRSSELTQLVNFHDKLNPDLWQDNQLRLDVRVALMRIAKAFVEFIDVPDLKLTDITFSGSNASYNYNKDSDVDLHLIASIDGPCGDNLKALFMSKKSEFNDQHDINVLGHSVEVYVQDSDEPHISNGIYSVYNGQWLKEPEPITAEPDNTNIQDKYDYLKYEIDQAIDSADPETIGKIKKKIKKMRQTGLESNGEFSTENLAFKLLRNTGELERLWKAEQQATDQRLSLTK